MPPDANEAVRLHTPNEAESSQAMQAEIRMCLDEWINEVNTGNPDSMNALYKADAVLLPTFDLKLRNTPAERKEYFVFFKSRKNLSATIDECHIAPLGESAGVADGFYTFHFIDEEGTQQNVKARFTFVCARQPEGDWQIVAHHSSSRPAL